MNLPPVSLEPLPLPDLWNDRTKKTIEMHQQEPQQKTPGVYQFVILPTKKPATPLSQSPNHHQSYGHVIVTTTLKPQIRPSKEINMNSQNSSQSNNGQQPNSVNSTPDQQSQTPVPLQTQPEPLQTQTNSQSQQHNFQQTPNQQNQTPTQPTSYIKSRNRIQNDHPPSQVHPAQNSPIPPLGILFLVFLPSTSFCPFCFFFPFFFPFPRILFKTHFQRTCQSHLRNKQSPTKQFTTNKQHPTDTTIT